MRQASMRLERQSNGDPDVRIGLHSSAQFQMTSAILLRYVMSGGRGIRRTFIVEELDELCLASECPELYGLCAEQKGRRQA